VNQKMMKSGDAVSSKSWKNRSGKTVTTTTTTIKTEATRDRIVPVGDKSCRIVLRRCVST